MGVIMAVRLCRQRHTHMEVGIPHGRGRWFQNGRHSHHRLSQRRAQEDIPQDGGSGLFARTLSGDRRSRVGNGEMAHGISGADHIQ